MKSDLIHPGDLLWLIDARQPEGLILVRVLATNQPLWFDGDNLAFVAEAVVVKWDESTGKPKGSPICTDCDFLELDKSIAAQSLEDTACAAKHAADGFRYLLEEPERYHGRRMSQNPPHWAEPSSTAQERRFLRMDQEDGIPTT